jgi:hypothetical protein
LTKKAETQLLSQQEWDLKPSINSRLTQLWREEEMRWFQRAKTTKILKGDSNTKFFQIVANGRRRKVESSVSSRKMELWRVRSISTNTSQNIIKVSLEN